MPSLFEACLFLRDFTLVILVQLFMLGQVGYFYIRLRCKHRKTRQIVPPPSEDLLIGPIAVIIPAYNEADIIEQTLRRLAIAAEDPSRLCVVVADSGCTDETMSIVQRLQASDLLGMSLRTSKARTPGRGGAINAGLEAAATIAGAVILFLHADAALPEKFDCLIRAGFAQPGVLMTAFEFCTNREELPLGKGPPTGMAFMEFTVNVRSRLYELPFGDQGLAVSRSVLEAVGGFPDYPILEEYELIQRLRRLSAEGAGRIITLRGKCRCSPRRWCERPIWKVNWVNQMTMLRYRFGATPEDIYRFYYNREPPVLESK